MHNNKLLSDLHWCGKIINKNEGEGIWWGGYKKCLKSYRDVLLKQSGVYKYDLFIIFIETIVKWQ